MSDGHHNELRQCCTCKLFKHDSEFKPGSVYKGKRYKRKVCKRCDMLRYKAWTKANPERHRASRRLALRRHHAKHRDTINRRARERRSANIEESRRREALKRTKNPESYRRAAQKYRQSHLKQCRADCREYSRNHYQSRPRRQRVRIMLDCEGCGKQYEKKHGARNTSYRVCSDGCKARVWLKYNRIVNCQNCGHEFPVSIRRPRIYCSKRCAGIGKRGERNPHWRGGKKGNTRALRAKTEYAVWRKAVFTRDKWKCRRCRKHTRTLRAHHVISVAENPALVFDVDNGLTLCDPCHKIVHKTEYTNRAKLRQPLLWGVDN